MLGVYATKFCFGADVSGATPGLHLLDVAGAEAIVSAGVVAIGNPFYCASLDYVYFNLQEIMMN